LGPPSADDTGIANKNSAKPFAVVPLPAVLGRPLAASSIVNAEALLMPEKSLYEPARNIPMNCHPCQSRPKNRSTVLVIAWMVLVGATLAARPISAQTYISAEPIPSMEIVGQANLAKIEGLGY